MKHDPLPLPGASRDHRVDLVRGLALVMIFINHIPGTMFERLTSRNFGFSDAAEAFVLLAGLAAALAYGRGMASGFTWAAVSKVWGRAWTLYLVHLMLSLVVLGLVAAVLRFGGSPALILQDNFQAFFRDPVGVLIGLPLMLHQFGYVNILPLYVLLLLAAPGALWLGQRAPGLLLGLSVALWLAAGFTRLNLLTYPGLNGWFLNPASWQLIFVIGLLTGLKMREGKRLVAVKPWLVALATGYLLLSLLWSISPAVAAAGQRLMQELTVLGLPRLLTGFDKGYLEVPRLLHVLALAYVASVLPGLRDAAASPRLRFLTVMGRQGLAVFALGTVLSFVARALRELALDAGYRLDPAFDFALVATGIGLQVLLAMIRDRLKQGAQAVRPTATVATAAKPARLPKALAPQLR